MTDTVNRTKRYDELPVATSVAKEDLFVVLDVSANTTKSVTFEVMVASLIPGPYTNDAEASLGEVDVGSLYYSADGLVHLRIV